MLRLSLKRTPDQPRARIVFSVYYYFYQPTQEGLCKEPDNHPSLSVVGETYGPDSRCFTHGRSWIQTNLASGRRTESIDLGVFGSGCYKVITMFQPARIRLAFLLQSHNLAGVPINSLGPIKKQKPFLIYNTQY